MSYSLIAILDTTRLEPLLAALEDGSELGVAEADLLSRLLLLRLQMSERLAALSMQLIGKPVMN